jgi:hypothetical protein
MEYAKRKDKLDKELKPFIKALTFQEFPIIQLGTSSFKVMKYYGDYDLFSPINRKIPDGDICRDIKTILKETDNLKNIYFVELKLQNAKTKAGKDGDKKKWHTVDVNCDDFEEQIKDLDYLKIDYIIYTDRLIELSIIYAFKPVPPDEDLLKMLSGDFSMYKEKGNLFKAYKRLFASARLLKQYSKMKVLTELFNSNTGKLYSINSNLKAIKMVLDNKLIDKYPKIIPQVATNTRQVGASLDETIGSEKDLDKIIEQVDNRIQKETVEWTNSKLKEHPKKFFLP